MNRLFTIATLALLFGIGIGACCVWRAAYHRGMNSFSRVRLKSDLGKLLIIAQRVRDDDSRGVSFLLNLEVDSMIMKFDELSKRRTLDEEEEELLSNAIAYRRKYPFDPDEYRSGSERILAERMKDILARRASRP